MMKPRDFFYWCVRLDWSKLERISSATETQELENNMRSTSVEFITSEGANWLEMVYPILLPYKLNLMQPYPSTPLNKNKNVHAATPASTNVVVGLVGSPYRSPCESSCGNSIRLIAVSRFKHIEEIGRNESQGIMFHESNFLFGLFGPTNRSTFSKYLTLGEAASRIWQLFLSLIATYSQKRYHLCINIYMYVKNIYIYICIYIIYTYWEYIHVYCILIYIKEVSH